MTPNQRTLGAALGLALISACSSTQLAAEDATQPDLGTAIDAAAPAAPIDDSTSFDLAFVTHLDMGLPEQDVFIERTPGSSEVWRVTKGDNDMSLPVFKTAQPVPHNPFDPAALGPHAKGEALGMTLGEWLRHRGTGTYTYADGTGSLDLEFTGLVPNGVYTMWHAFMAMPPTTPFSGALELPLGAGDGSESVFVADESGRAHFVHTFSPGLEMSDVWTTSMLAINYHSDGKTYGGLPGDFGLNAHIPLFLLLPKRAGLR